MELVEIRSTRHKRCGYCSTGHHGHCPVGVEQPATTRYPNGSVWICQCPACDPDRIRCLACSNRSPIEVDRQTWRCKDRDACDTTLEVRQKADPFHQQMEQIRKDLNIMAPNTVTTEGSTDTEAKPAKKVAAPKVGKCLVTGKPTKGGKFLPGMDARYVSDRVKDVITKVTTKPQAVKRMKDDGVSETLIAKFEKNLAIAQDRETSKAQAAKDKEQAKKDKVAADKAAQAEANTAA